MEKNKKMTLKDYYDSLPKPTNPKTDFLCLVSFKTGKSQVAVSNWIAGRSKPKDLNDIQVLSEITGIPADDLFDDSTI